MPPVILFASAVFPGQFTGLCAHLNQTGLAEAHFLTTPGNVARYGAQHANLLPFTPDGDYTKTHYYYAAKTERSARLSRGLLKAVRAFSATRRPDLIVCHGLWAPPMFLYDEVDTPIVSYLEFPSYRAHGWQADYPPDESQRLTDRNMEMLSLHQVLRSALTIVPSAYARSLFAPELQPRIAVQFEGFQIEPAPAPAPRSDDRPVIGFAARDLSSAKGFEIFIRLADRMIRDGDPARFIAIGDPAATTYGYEQQFVQRRHGAGTSFRDYLLDRYPAARAVEFPGRLPYAEYAQLLHGIDLFLYPLRHGVANWGLMEIMVRGRAVIGSDRCFLPELIRHGENGLLLPDDDDLWLREIRRLLADPAERARLGAGAAGSGGAYRMDKVAPRYMALFERAMATGNRGGAAWDRG